MPGWEVLGVGLLVQMVPSRGTGPAQKWHDEMLSIRYPEMTGAQPFAIYPLSLLAMKSLR